MISSFPKAGVVALLFAVALVTAAPAQDAKKLPELTDLAPPETVVVTGHRPAPETVHDVVWKYIYARAGYGPKIDQLTRWIDPVCPEVRNLPPGYGIFIVARIKAIAASVGAPVRARCRPNIEIIFTVEPQAVMDGVAAKNPMLLGYHFVHDTEEAAKVTRPVQAWYVTATTNGVETFIDDPYRGTPGGAAGSRLSHGQKSIFAHVLILANTDILAGHPIGPVADYLAVLSLSQSRADDDCSRLPSILDLLSPGCAEADRPTSFTIADKTYLEGLYGMDLVQIGSLQRSNISEYMIRSLGGR